MSPSNSTARYGDHFRQAVAEIRALPPSERSAMENRRTRGNSMSDAYLRLGSLPSTSAKFRHVDDQPPHKSCECDDCDAFYRRPVEEECEHGETGCATCETKPPADLFDPREKAAMTEQPIRDAIRAVLRSSNGLYELEQMLEQQDGGDPVWSEDAFIELVIEKIRAAGGAS